MLPLDSEIKIIKEHLRKIEVPTKMVQSIETKSLRSGRRMTGKFKSNRQSRWKLSPSDPQYGEEYQCKLIFIKLIGKLMKFKNAPKFDFDKISYFYFENLPCQDPLTYEILDYNSFLSEAISPNHGHSNFHIGHINPSAHPKHTYDNVEWMLKRSNLIQGDMTIQEAQNHLLSISRRIISLNFN